MDAMVRKCGVHRRRSTHAAGPGLASMKGYLGGPFCSRKRILSTQALKSKVLQMTERKYPKSRTSD